MVDHEEAAESADRNAGEAIDRCASLHEIKKCLCPALALQSMKYSSLCAALALYSMKYDGACATQRNSS